jgi:hypothetical protein
MIDHEEKHDASRREFLLSIARWATAAVAVGAVAKLATKPNDTCTSQGICRGCPEFEGCGHPQALSAKAVQRDS